MDLLVSAESDGGSSRVVGGCSDGELIAVSPWRSLPVLLKFRRRGFGCQERNLGSVSDEAIVPVRC